MAYSWLEFEEHNVNYAHFVLLILLFWVWADRIEFWIDAVERFGDDMTFSRFDLGF